MKNLMLAAVLALGLISCNDDAHITIHEDMMYFLQNESLSEGYVSPVTEINAKPRTRVDLLVVRNAFAAMDHPKQTVKIAVDEERSSAISGTDFTFDQQVLTFSGKDMLQLPVYVNVHRSAAGKKIVLRLDYEYYEECHPEGRKADRLTITVKE